MTTVVRGGWVLATESGLPQLLRDGSVVVEEGRIAAITPGDAGPADVKLEIPRGWSSPAS